MQLLRYILIAFAFLKQIPVGVYTTIFNFIDETQESLQNITIDKMELARYMTNIVKTLYNE